MKNHVYMGFNEIRVINTTSIWVELISVISLLADGKEKKSHPVILSIKKKLSKESLSFLTVLAQLRRKGLEMIEFLLQMEDYQDINKLLDKMDEYPSEEFLFYFFGEEIEKGMIKDVLNGGIAVKSIFQKTPWLDGHDVQVLEMLFYQTEDYRRKIRQLIIEVNDEALRYFLDNLKNQYVEGMTIVQEKLKGKSPLDTAQDLMGKKFKRVYDFSKYVFIPSYFIDPHHIRFFNGMTQILIYRIHDQERNDEGNVETLSNYLKIISDKTRLEILKILAEEPAYGKNIANKMGLSTATISHHIEQLRAIGLIHEERVKNIKYFSTNTKQLQMLMMQINKYILNQ